MDEFAGLVDAGQDEGVADRPGFEQILWTQQDALQCLGEAEDWLSLKAGLTREVHGSPHGAEPGQTGRRRRFRMRDLFR